jgi:hypothetical protein
MVSIIVLFSFSSIWKSDIQSNFPSILIGFEVARIPRCAEWLFAEVENRLWKSFHCGTNGGKKRKLDPKTQLPSKTYSV